MSDRRTELRYRAPWVDTDPRGYTVVLQETTWLRKSEKHWEVFAGGNIVTAVTATLTRPSFILSNPRSPTLMIQRVADERYERRDEQLGGWVVVPVRVADVAGEEMAGGSEPLVVSAPARVAVTCYVSDGPPNGTKIWSV